jgi:Listeria/Bacterioides repeat
MKRSLKFPITLVLFIAVALIAVNLRYSAEAVGGGGNPPPPPPLAGDTGWYSDSGTEFTLSTADQLTGFSSLVNDGKSFSGKTVVLGADITLSGSWTPAGGSSKKFEGTFDGNGRAISGLYIDGTSNYCGLFGYVGENGSVSNLILASVHIKGSFYNGAAAGSNAGQISRVAASGGVESTQDYAGGIVGINEAAGTITLSINNAAVSAGGSFAAGIAGVNEGRIAKSKNTGEISGENYSGGIAGKNNRTAGNDDSGKITGCLNLGTIEGDDSGGIAGESNGAIISCYNSGAISDPSSGGLVGDWSGGSVSISFYLDSSASSAFGGIPDSDNTNLASASQLLSGRIAVALDAYGSYPYWGQADFQSYPDIVGLDASAAVKRVFKVEFSSLTEETIVYVLDGTAAAAPEYTLAGHTLSWNKDISAVHSSFTTNAVWTPNVYPLVLSENGGIYAEDYTEPSDYTYGTAPALPAATDISKTGYTFLGWTATDEASDTDYISAVAADRIGETAFYAKWQANSYTVTWNVDGTETEIQCLYGETPAFGGVPEKAEDAEYTYTFTGWSSEISAVTGNVTYSAVFAAVLKPVAPEEGPEKSALEIWEIALIATGGTCFLFAAIAAAIILVKKRRKIS